MEHYRRETYQQWTTSYRVRAYINNAWIIVEPHSENDSGDNKFTANEDNNTQKISKFKHGIITDKVRIYPVDYNSACGGRFGVQVYI